MRGIFGKCFYANRCGIVEVKATSGGAAWLMVCQQANIAHIPRIYFGVFLEPVAMRLTAMHYLPTSKRIRWWLLSSEL